MSKSREIVQRSKSSEIAPATAEVRSLTPIDTTAEDMLPALTEPVGRSRSGRHEVWSFREVRDVATLIWTFARQCRSRSPLADETREAVRKVLKVYGRGYVIEFPTAGADAPNIAFDVEAANKKFHAVSVKARRMRILSPQEIMKIRESCYFDAAFVDDRERATEELEQTIARQPLLPPGDGNLPQLAEALFGATRAMRTHAFRQDFATDTELFRVADGLAVLLIDHLGEKGIRSLPADKLRAAAAKAYTILSRAEYQGQLSVARGGPNDEWMQLFEGRALLRNAILDAAPPAKILSEVLVEDLRLQLELKGPRILTRLFVKSAGWLEGIVRQIDAMSTEEVSAVYEAIASEPFFHRQGVRQQLLIQMRRLLERFRTDLDDLLPLMRAADARVPRLEEEERAARQGRSMHAQREIEAIARGPEARLLSIEKKRPAKA